MHKTQFYYTQEPILLVETILNVRYVKNRHCKNTSNYFEMTEMFITLLCPKNRKLSCPVGLWQFSQARVLLNSKFLAKEGFHDLRFVKLQRLATTCAWMRAG